MNKQIIFCFGSNREGRHGKGAALYAHKHHGAIYGQAEGLQGNSYAIVTKELRDDQPRVGLEEIRAGVTRFVEFADKHPEMTFKVTEIGCNLAGFTPALIAPLFVGAPENVELPESFWDVILGIEEQVEDSYPVKEEEVDNDEFNPLDYEQTK